MSAPGLELEAELKQAGFSDLEIAQHRADTKADLQAAGFKKQEVMDYYGIKEPDMGPSQDYIRRNIDRWRAEQGLGEGQAGPPQMPAGPLPRTAALDEEKTWWDNFLGGLQDSSGGWIARGGKAPEKLHPEDAGRVANILHSAGMAVGDIPVGVAAAIPAFMAGSAAGGAMAAPLAVAPGIGAALVAGGAAIGGSTAAWAAGNAAPAAVRKILMDMYERGEVQSFDEFWHRFSGATMVAMKAGAVGAVGGAAGVGAKALPILSGTTKAVTAMGAEAAAMTAVGAGLEGQMPTADDFINNAILVGGLNATVKTATTAVKYAPVVPGAVATKMRNIFAEKGIGPKEVAEISLDPGVRQEMVAVNAPMPTAVGGEGVVPVHPETQVLAKTIEQGAPIAKAEAAPIAKAEAAPIAKAEAAPVKTDLESAMERSQNKIHTIAKVDRSLPLKEQADQYWRSFMYNLVDKFDPLKRFTEAMAKGESLDLAEDPNKLARLSVAAGQKAVMKLEVGTFDFANPTKKTGKSFEEVIHPVRENLQEFGLYAVSRRALEIESQGKKSGFDPADSKTIVDSLGPKYEKHFQELVGYRNRLLKYLSDSGVVSSKLYDQLTRENVAYVPFSRFFSDEGDSMGVGDKNRTVFNALKKLKGSGRDIYNPIEVIAADTRLFVQLAERNRSLKALADLIDTDPELAALYGVKKVKGKTQAIGVTEGELEAFFKENGLEDFAAELDANSKREMFTVFRGKYTPLQLNQFAAFKDGKRQVYEAPMELARSVQALTPKEQHLMYRMMAPFARSLRAGATLTLEFGLGNFQRDQIHAAIMGKGSYTPYKNWMEGVKSLWNHDASWAEAMSSGLGDSATNAFDQYMNRLTPAEAKATITDRMLNAVRNPLQMTVLGWKKSIEALEVLSTYSEMGTRLGYYKRLGELNPGMPAFEKAYKTREITIDFQKSGAVGQSLNMISAFWNARVQGITQFNEALRTDPIGIAAQTFKWITLPSIALWLVNKDDPNWQDAAEWKKRSCWYIPLANSTVPGLWIPMPHELGLLFGTVPVLALEAASKQDAQAFKNFEKTVFSVFEGLVPVPTVARPLAEHAFNKSFFTKNPVVPHDLEKDTRPWAQYTQNTSTTAIALGEAMKGLPLLGESSFASPMVMDNYIRGWTGGLGKYALDAIDMGLEASGVGPEVIRPEKKLTDYPVIRAFGYRYPENGMQPVTDFYERSQVYAKYQGTADHLKKTLQFEEFQKFVADPETQDKLLSLTNVRKSMTEKSRIIHSLNYIKDMTPNEKMQFKERLYIAIINEAKFGNQIMDSIENRK